MKRILVAVVLSLAALALVAVVVDVPDPVGVHVGPDGRVDGVAPRAILLPLLVGLPAVVSLVLFVVTRTRTRPPAGMRWTLGLPVGATWGIGGVAAVLVFAQDGLDDATDATIPLVWVLVVLVVAVVVTLLASRLATLDDPVTSVDPAPGDSPREDLPRGATAVWTASTPTGTAPMAMAVAVVALGTGLGLVVSWWLTALLAVVAAVLLASSRFAVTIGPAGVRVAGLLGGWPRVEIPLDTVVRADVALVRALEYGGWGLRARPGLSTTAVVTRSGPGLCLERTDGSRFLVTVDDPGGAAAVVSTLLDRRGPGRAPRTSSGRR